MNITPMRDLDSAPQPSTSNVSQVSNHKEEPRTPMHGTKRIRSPTQDVHSSQRRCKHPELLMGYSPTLIGDMPPSKSTSIRLQKPTLVMERVGSNACPHIMTAQHPPPMVHPPVDVSTAVDFYDTPNLYQEWLYQHGVDHRLPKSNSVSRYYIFVQWSKDKKSSRSAERTPEESEEDDGGSLADFIVDDEVDEDEYSDVTDKGAVIPGQDINEDPHILASDSEDGHSATSVALHQKKCKGKGRIIEDVDEDKDSPDEYGQKMSEARKEKKTSTPLPPVSFTPAMKRVLPSQNTNHLTSQDEVEVDSETELPIWKAVYH
ncbi:hypothetical protein K439DRAFT_1619941 [Ramaria rubella]|nr:hypothetical protein K439DRAFT_1619941 [Ramaria rubella]